MVLVHCALIGAAHAQTVNPPDVAVSTLGVQTWSDSAIRDVYEAPTDMDLLVAQRLRWTLAGDQSTPGPALVAMIDGRFILDPTGPEARPIEWGYVRTLGAEVVSDKWVVDIGRSQVYRGGPRLVDGVQAMYKPSDTIRIGVWGGLAPNLFTTVPTVRPGGGPIFSYATSKTQLSVVGEAVMFEGGLDRAGVLTLGRVSLERTLDVMGRLDVELAGPVEDGPRLVDGMLAVVGNPTQSLRLDLLYDAFSSYRYIGSEALDPSLRRFQDRLGAIGQANPLFLQDERDPTLNHLVGGGIRFQPEGGGTVPRLGVTVRYRHHPLEENRYLRINPQAGVLRLGDTLDVIADANLIQLHPREDLVLPGGEDPTGQQIDGGLLLYFEPPGSPVALDGSLRGILAHDDFPGLGFYGDLFVNVVSPQLDVIFIAGAAAMTETDLLDEQGSLGIQGFVQMTKYLRPPRR
ncbi:MAG: hypothetical protein R3F59_36830 [Myxococcota bacterium]